MGLTIQNLPLTTLFTLSTNLLIISLVGVVWNKRNFLIMMLCIEMMFFAISLNFLFIIVSSSNIYGVIYPLMIVTAAATETAVGLGLLIVAYRLSTEVSYNSLITLRG